MPKNASRRKPSRKSGSTSSDSSTVLASSTPPVRPGVDTESDTSTGSARKRTRSGSSTSSRSSEWRPRTQSSSTSASGHSPSVAKDRSVRRKSSRERKKAKLRRSRRKKSYARRKRSEQSAKSRPNKKEKEGKEKAAEKNTATNHVMVVESQGTTSAVAAGIASDKSARMSLPALADLQKQLDQDRNNLQLFIIKAKQEHEENKGKQESSERKERREKEYFKASFGDPCGPGNRFLLEEELGRGAFSTVFKGRDIGGQGRDYAIKFIRNNSMLRQASEKEVRVMRRLRSQASENDPEGARCFLGLAGPEVFEHDGHLAMVFQLQRCSLRLGLQKYGQGHGLPLHLVRSYARNIFLALRALRRINLIHSDLKPDNLLISLDKASVKLSDFGSAMEPGERVRTDFVQPMYYRAPEVILGHAYGVPIDTWSAGATIYELATGHFLFTGRTNNNMVHAMLRGCGAFAKAFSTLGDFASRHFSAGGDFKLHHSGSYGKGEELMPMGQFPRASQPFLKKLQELLKEPTEGMDARCHQVMVRHLADLVSRCVTPDPAERFTPEAALAHKLLRSSSASEDPAPGRGDDPNASAAAG